MSQRSYAIYSDSTMSVFISNENNQCYTKQLLQVHVTYNYCWRVKIFTWKVKAEGRKASKKDWGQRQSWQETHPEVAWFASHCINYCHSSCSKGRLPAPILTLGHRASQFPWAGYRARRVDIDAVNKIKDLPGGQISPEKCNHHSEAVQKSFHTYFQGGKFELGHQLLKRKGLLFHKPGYCHWCFHKKNMLQRCLRRLCQSSQTSRSTQSRLRHNRNWIM